MLPLAVHVAGLPCSVGPGRLEQHQQINASRERPGPTEEAYWHLPLLGILAVVCHYVKRVTAFHLLVLHAPLIEDNVMRHGPRLSEPVLSPPLLLCLHLLIYHPVQDDTLHHTHDTVNTSGSRCSFCSIHGTIHVWFPET